MSSKLVIGRRSALLAASAVFAAGRSYAQSSPITADIIAKANEEGVVVFYTSVDLPVAQAMAKQFSDKYPKIRVQIERTGSERVLQRVMQEYASNIHDADVVENSDITMFIVLKQKKWLAQHVPDDVAQFWPADQKDPDGFFAASRSTLSVIAYNTKQVKPEDAPKSFADLLAPKWNHRMVKAHPGYSGNILSATYATEKKLGWEYFEKLAKQNVMQVQSASDTAKVLARGERAVMVDGSEFSTFYVIDHGDPVAIVYATEGSPLISGQSAVMLAAPHPNAARLFQSHIFSQECQQLMSDFGGTRSPNPAVKLKAGRKPITEIPVLHFDPNDLLASAEEVKKKYSALFGV